MDTGYDTEPDGIFPPAFWTGVAGIDARLLKSQNRGRRFDMSLVSYVARRCSSGVPQVTVCRPVSSGGRPFPTIFWLTCPYLDRRCGGLESEHKIQELEGIFQERLPDVKRWHYDYSVLRRRLLGADEEQRIKSSDPAIWEALGRYGVGGINWTKDPFAVKCLHLQAATWLGWHRHPAGDWLMAELGALECADGACCNYQG